MATHSSNLAVRISWTEEPGGPQSMGSQRVGHDWVTNIFTYIKWGWSSLKVQVNRHKLVAQNPMVPAPITLHSLPLLILIASWEFPMTSYWKKQIRRISSWIIDPAAWSAIPVDIGQLLPSYSGDPEVQWKRKVLWEGRIWGVHFILYFICE